jgi:hypothetical protein
MRKILLLLTLGAISGSVSAEIYKCLENGRLTISDAPCPSGAVCSVLSYEPQNSRPHSPTEELETLKQKLEVMQRERQEREAVYEAEQKQQNEMEALQKQQNEIEAKKQAEADQEAQIKANIKKKKRKKLEEEEEERRRLEWWLYNKE